MDANGNIELSTVTLTELCKRARELKGESPSPAKAARDAEAIDLVGQMLGFGEPFAHAVKNRFDNLAGEYKTAMADCAVMTRRFENEQRLAIAKERERADKVLSDARTASAQTEQLANDMATKVEAILKAREACDDPTVANVIAMQRGLLEGYKDYRVDTDVAARMTSYTLWAYLTNASYPVETEGETTKQQKTRR